MNKIGLKLYSTNDKYLKAALALYTEGVYDYIELLPVPGTYDSTLAGWKALQIPFVIHAPHFSLGVNLGMKDLFDKNMAAAKETLKFADALDSEHVIFHPGTGGDIRESARQLKLINDSRIIVENKPCKTIDGRFRCLGGSHDEIRLVMETAGVGFCLDIGHAISYSKDMGKDWGDYLGGFLAMKPAMYHISDGNIDSGTDLHEHLGAGNYPWRSILPLIPQGSRVTIETKKDFQDSLEDFHKDAEFFRKSLEVK